MFRLGDHTKLTPLRQSDKQFSYRDGQLSSRLETLTIRSGAFDGLFGQVEVCSGGFSVVGFGCRFRLVIWRATAAETVDFSPVHRKSSCDRILKTQSGRVDRIRLARDKADQRRSNSISSPSPDKVGRRSGWAWRVRNGHGSVRRWHAGCRTKAGQRAAELSWIAWHHCSIHSIRWTDSVGRARS
jgi:hypothetical protein